MFFYDRAEYNINTDYLPTDTSSSDSHITSACSNIE